MFLLQCSQTDSLDVFFEDILSTSKTQIALLGCGCSVATLPVAEISHYWNISQVIIVSKLILDTRECMESAQWQCILF